MALAEANASLAFSRRLAFFALGFILGFRVEGFGLRIHVEVERNLQGFTQWDLAGLGPAGMSSGMTRIVLISTTTGVMLRELKYYATVVRKPHYLLCIPIMAP